MDVLIVEDVPSLTAQLTAKFTNAFRARFVSTRTGTEAELKVGGKVDALVIDVLHDYDNGANGVALYDLVYLTLRPETKVIMVGHTQLVPDTLHRAMKNRGLMFVDFADFNPATQLL